LKIHPKFKELVVLFAITCGAVAVHGYHPNAEDAAIYLPGVEKALYPALFPQNQQFFASHAHLTMFPQLIAWSVRVMHLSLYPALLLWHLTSIFLLLFACWRFSAFVTEVPLARWAGVGLVAALLTLPVAGTALYIMDQYLNPRNLTAFVGVLAVVMVLERRLFAACLILLLGVVIHPFMSFFAAGYCAILVIALRDRGLPRFGLASVAPLSLLPLRFLYQESTPAYHEVALSHPYHYLLHWQWYEWLGALGPLLIFWLLSGWADSTGRRALQVVCKTSVVVGTLSFMGALFLAIPDRFETLARIQPLRSLFLIYVLLLVTAGALIEEYLLKAHVRRWILLFAPLCLGMFLAQRALFPASNHIEWPGERSKNAWVQAFEWARGNTPVDALFALDPYHMRIAGEDANGFRAISQRSMLADAIKDSGAVSMFPSLADTWLHQVEAAHNWKAFQTQDFQRLQRDYGVGWVVLERPAVPGLNCVYQNQAVSVCRLENDSLTKQFHP
jgi:hypothetical protein